MPMISRLAKADDTRLDELLRIYREAIPKRERKPDQAVAAMLDSPKHVLTVAEDDQHVLGFSILYTGEHLAVLEYLASDQRVRGQGIGAELFRIARQQTGARPLIVEVESNCEDKAEQATRARRIDFYSKLGCRRVVGFNFILPLPGTGDPPRLDLLVDGWRRSTVARRDFERWLTEIYVGIYGCNAKDSRLCRMLSGLPAELRLE